MFSMFKIMLLFLTIFLSPIYISTRRLSRCKFMHLCWKPKLFIDRVYLRITGPELIFQQYLGLCHVIYQKTSFSPFISVMHINFSTRRNVCIFNLENSFWWKSEKFLVLYCSYLSIYGRKNPSNLAGCPQKLVPSAEILTLKMMLPIHCLNWLEYWKKLSPQ